MTYREAVCSRRLSVPGDADAVDKWPARAWRLTVVRARHLSTAAASLGGHGRNSGTSESRIPARPMTCVLAGVGISYTPWP